MAIAQAEGSAEEWPFFAFLLSHLVTQRDRVTGCEKSSWPGRGGSPLLPALALAHTRASVFPHLPEGTANAGRGLLLCLQTETWAGCALRRANLHMTGPINMNTGSQTHRQTQTDLNVITVHAFLLTCASTVPTFHIYYLIPITTT